MRIALQHRIGDCPLRALYAPLTALHTPVDTDYRGGGSRLSDRRTRPEGVKYPQVGVTPRAGTHVPPCKRRKPSKTRGPF